jgi:hypothetical protein
MKFDLILLIFVGMIIALPQDNHPGLINTHIKQSVNQVHHYRRGKDDKKDKGDDSDASAKGDGKGESKGGDDVGGGIGDLFSGGVDVLGVSIPTIVVVAGVGFIIWKFVLKK